MTGGQIRPTLRQDIERVINSHSRENVSGTPDFILAEYLLAALDNAEAVIKARDRWYRFEPMLGTVPAVDPRPPLTHAGEVSRAARAQLGVLRHGECVSCGRADGEPHHPDCAEEIGT